MRSGMPRWRRVTALHMAAHPAHAQMHPPAAGPQAVLTTVSRRTRLRVDPVEVRATIGHGILRRADRSSSDRYRQTRSNQPGCAARRPGSRCGRPDLKRTMRWPQTRSPGCCRPTTAPAPMFNRPTAAIAIGTRGRQLSPSSIRRVHAALRSALNTIVKRRLISYNLALQVQLAPRPLTGQRPQSGVNCSSSRTERDRLSAPYHLMIVTGPCERVRQSASAKTSILIANANS